MLGLQILWGRRGGGRGEKQEREREAERERERQRERMSEKRERRERHHSIKGFSKADQMWVRRIAQQALSTVNYLVGSGFHILNLY